MSIRVNLPKRIILIRHGESSKNVSFSYSSIEGHEPLTETGNRQAKYIAEQCRLAIDRSNRERIGVFTSTADRAIDTVQPLAGLLSVPVATLSELAPLHDPTLAGKNIEAAHSEAPLLGKEVGLYRAGMMSGYDVSWPGGGIRSLESRVKRMMRERLTSRYDLAIIVGHKSTLTCLIINILRAFGNYPVDFYGYVDLELGSIVSIECQSMPPQLDFLSAHGYPRRKAIR